MDNYSSGGTSRPLDKMGSIVVPPGIPILVFCPGACAVTADRAVGVLEMPGPFFSHSCAGGVLKRFGFKIFPPSRPTFSLFDYRLSRHHCCFVIITCLFFLYSGHPLIWLYHKCFLVAMFLLIFYALCDMYFVCYSYFERCLYGIAFISS